MTADDFKAFQGRQGWNNAETSRRTGLSRRTVQMYADGINDVPVYVALACAALEAGLAPLGAVAEAEEAI
jgi:hypothetical protein